MKIKRLKELIENIPDDVDVYFMFGLNDKYEDKENGIFTLKENGENSYFKNKLIFTLKDTENCSYKDKDLSKDEKLIMSKKELKEKYCYRCVNSDWGGNCIAKQASFNTFVCDNGEMFVEKTSLFKRTNNNQNI